jgi:hypothetical protein
MRRCARDLREQEEGAEGSSAAPASTEGRVYSKVGGCTREFATAAAVVAVACAEEAAEAAVAAAANRRCCCLSNSAGCVHAEVTRA